MSESLDQLYVYIGWDNREKVAYEVLKHSIEKHTHAKLKIVLCIIRS
jgi:hypothetical protein